MLHIALILLLLQTRAPATVGVAETAGATQAPSQANDGVVQGTVQGAIHAEGQSLPGEMVVYLEPSAPVSGAAAPQKRVRISQKGAQFSPAFTVVSVGQAVEFVNDEDRAVEHNVFSNAPNAQFDFGLFPAGESRTWVFDKPGPVVLYCSIHKFMDGVIYVCPTPYFCRVDADGRYRIEDVPAGEYTLKTWQRRRRFPEQSIAIKVGPGQSVTADLDLHRK